VAVGLLRDPAPLPVATGKPRPVASVPPSKPAYTIPGTPGPTAPAATPPTGCRVERLTVPGDSYQAIAGAMDPTGSYQVGRTYPKSGGYRAAVWHDGRITNVNLPGDLEESLTDVNSAGVAVGWSYTGSTDADTGPAPYVYRNGKAAKLPGARRGQAHAINEAGAIVGDDNQGHALLWTSPTATPVRLPGPPGANEVRALDIDDDGTVVGDIDLEKPYVWFPDGTHRELPLPAVDDDKIGTARAFAIRNGWVTGVADGGIGGAVGGRDGRLYPVRWNLRTGEVRVFAELDGGADAVSAQGWQVGTDRKGRAVLLTGGTPVLLPALISAKPNGVSTIANALSDDGRVIAGQSDDANGSIRPVLWRCR
jgi:uncharacterized membrane protein